MEPLAANDRVELVKELADLQLRPGEVGIVRDCWPYPAKVYEVEFQVHSAPIRVLVFGHQITSRRGD
jgi:hypothetical protein